MTHDRPSTPAGTGPGYSGQEPVSHDLAPAADRSAATPDGAASTDRKQVPTGVDRRDLPPEAGHGGAGAGGSGEVHGSGAGAGGGNPGEDYDSDIGGSTIADQSQDRSR